LSSIRTSDRSTAGCSTSISSGSTAPKPITARINKDITVDELNDVISTEDIEDFGDTEYLEL